MLAVELVVLHERKHQMGQAEHLVEGGSVGLVDQKIAVFRDDPLLLRLELAGGTLDIYAFPNLFDIAG